MRQLNKKYAPPTPERREDAFDHLNERLWRSAENVDAVISRYLTPARTPRDADARDADDLEHKGRSPFSILRPPPHNETNAPAAEPTKLLIKCLDSGEDLLITPSTLEKTGGAVCPDSETARNYRRGLSFWNDAPRNDAPAWRPPKGLRA